MPVARIPLAGSFNQRGIAGGAVLTLSEDQRFLNCAFNVVQNPITGRSTAYVEKRPGWGQDSLVASGSASTGLIRPQSITATFTAFGDTNSTIYFGTTSIGAITGRALYFNETIISGTSYIVIKSSDGTGWYYVNGAKDTLTYTGDTHTNTLIDNIASTTGMYVGQAVSGTNIVAGTRILTVSATSITLDTATTGTTVGITVTKTPIAKITSANFVTTGTYISAFAEMDGFLFYATGDGNVRNSDLNTVITYQASNYIPTPMSPDAPVAIVRHKNAIGVLGTGSLEVLTNAGNSTGSPLKREPQYFSRTGALSQSSIATLENDIFFIGSSNYGDVQAFRLRELQVQKISNPSVDKILGTVTTTGGLVYLSAFQLGGYPYVLASLSTSSETNSNLLLESGDVVLLETADKTLIEGSPSAAASFSRQLVYNAALNVWSEWDASVATFVVGKGAGSNNQVLATSRFGTGGKVYTINPTSDGALYQDDGVAYTTQIRTSRLDMGTNSRKFIKRVRFVGDTQTAGTATLEASDDDYSTWTTLGTFDLTVSAPTISMCGSHTGGRAYRLSHSYNGPFRGEALEIEYEVGTV